MMYHLQNDVACPKCKNTTFKIEDHTEQRPVDGEEDSYIRYREIYCEKCLTTIERIDT